MQRKQVLSTKLDTDKAPLGLSTEMFDCLQSCVNAEYTRKQRNDDNWNRMLFFNLSHDLERLARQDKEHYEVWMEYWVLEEISHVVSMHGGFNAVELEAEISDVLREFEYLEEPV